MTTRAIVQAVTKDAIKSGSALGRSKVLTKVFLLQESLRIKERSKVDDRFTELLDI